MAYPFKKEAKPAYLGGRGRGEGTRGKEKYLR
jgi:hypothetical protein